MEKDELCKQVLDLDSRIRFAGVINENGRLIAGGMRSGFKSLEDSKDDEMLYMELVLRARMRKEFDKVLGPVKFAMSYRDKLIIMSFPVEENILLISVEKDIDFSKLPFNILDIINH
ncbi:conserved hypothetical protein [Nitrosotalea sinensis]|jgi:hypothetical protein|uniref:Roadblock/LAMTOR2 domain-containing protein n=1 Tax=Nitrosotalea sinensis TaxID=1499975 RepID=A0A2H1EGP0_9ARCH|nr:DUF6659 family protein [Candidatus Nitrosotalea sinensis]SHO44692.1 conserved hypothetical protein [Candidatus Nitrosotalea sinensis]